MAKFEIVFTVEEDETSSQHISIVEVDYYTQAFELANENVNNWQHANPKSITVRIEAVDG